jgi:hypothetical protein
MYLLDFFFLSEIPYRDIVPGTGEVILAPQILDNVSLLEMLNMLVNDQGFFMQQICHSVYLSELLRLKCLY